MVSDPQLQTAGLVDSGFAARGERREISVAFDWLLILAIYGGYWALLTHHVFGDDFNRLDLVRKLAGAPVDVSSSAKFSLIQPLLMLPLYELGSPYYLLLSFNCIVAGVGIASLYGVLRRFVDRRILRRFMLILLAASMLPHWALYIDAEMFSAMAVAIGLAALVTNRPWLAAAPLVLGAANTPALLPALALAVGRHCFDRRRWRYLLIPAIAVGIFLLECRVRRGGWWITGYEGDHGDRNILPYSGEPGFSYPLIFGLLSIFFSFGKGLIFFAPGLFLPGAPGANRSSKTLNEFRVLCLWFVAGMVLVYARFWSWYGGFSWGPRFFLFASIPASLMLATWLGDQSLSLGRRGLIGGMIVLSAWVAIDGAVFDLNGLAFVAANHFSQEFLIWYTAEYSPLWHPLVSMPAFSAREGMFIFLMIVATLWLLNPLTRGLRAALVFAASGRAESN